jgi:hypothetical protein
MMSESDVLAKTGEDRCQVPISVKVGTVPNRCQSLHDRAADLARGSGMTTPSGDAPVRTVPALRHVRDDLVANAPQGRRRLWNTTTERE